ncbi:WD40-repeat-containing domain protein [Suillus subluteus]|nr:WD40-repeat-containing domain protein [Suillus subluteus]
MVSQPTPALSPPTLVPQQTSCVTQLSQTFEGHRKSISAVAAMPNTQRMVTSSKDNTLCLWELTTKKLLKHLVGHPSVVSGLAVSRDGKFIASCDITGGIIPWDGETGVCLINDAQGVGFTKTEFTAKNGSPVTYNGSTRSTQNGFAVAHNGVTTAHNGSTNGHNGSTNGHNGSTNGHNGSTNGHNGSTIAHKYNGATFAYNGSTTAQNGSAPAQTDESVALQLIIAHQSSEVHISLDFSADGTTLASAGDRTVRFWCTAAWKENQDAIPLDAVVHCVRYSSSGELLAIATENNIYIYNPATRQRIKMLKGHSGGTFTLTWTLQGTYLLSGGGERDPTVRVWEVLKGGEIEAFRGHTDKISTISVNESSTIITSASSDGSIRLWPFPKSNVLDVAAGAFCVTFFSGGDDQKISQWVLPSTGLVSVCYR